MAVKSENSRFQITLTPEEKQQLKELCSVTGEKPSAIIRRLVATEYSLHNAGFVLGINLDTRERGKNEK